VGHRPALLSLFFPSSTSPIFVLSLSVPSLRKIPSGPTRRSAPRSPLSGCVLPSIYNSTPSPWAFSRPCNSIPRLFRPLILSLPMFLFAGCVGQSHYLSIPYTPVNFFPHLPCLSTRSFLPLSCPETHRTNALKRVRLLTALLSMIDRAVILRSLAYSLLVAFPLLSFMTWYMRIFCARLLPCPVPPVRTNVSSSEQVELRFSTFSRGSNPGLSGRYFPPSYDVNEPPFSVISSPWILTWVSSTLSR